MVFKTSIQNTNHTLAADILPCHGGMVSQIYLERHSVLHVDDAVLETAPMAAGGMPLLFPFSGKTQDDRYDLDGREYYMPMHGLVKNAAFAVKDQQTDCVTLWIESSPAWISQCYPFDFHLEVQYRVEGMSLFSSATVSNRSSSPMPHYMGWHPFFKASDKTGMTLRYDMTAQYDYHSHTDRAAPHALSLGSYLDDVFHIPRSNGFTLAAPADGYVVECIPDPVFQALVVCSWVEDSMCVEPWCGLPDAINNRRLLSWIPPHAAQTYSVEWRFRPL